MPGADLSSTRIALLGAGKMGSALLQGWLAEGLKPSNLFVIDPFLAEELERDLAPQGAHLSRQPDPKALARVEVLVIAIKPQQFDTSLPNLAPVLPKSALVISIAAGQTIAGMEARLGPGRTIVRTMPNTPAALGAGITGATASKALSSGSKRLVERLFAATGGLVWVENETMIDAVTAISGSGPAYFFYMTECLAKAGEALGLDKEVAYRLASSTLSGAGTLLKESGMPASELRQNVTSPGGTTAAALEILMSSKGLETPVKSAVVAAFQRAQDLGS